MTDARSQGLALVFLERFWADQDAGKEVSFTDYLAQFPGDEETIASEYLSAITEARGEVDVESPEVDGEHIGPYRLIKELGRGGQGIVWLAEDTRLGRNVALKVLTGMGPGAEGHLARFKREAALASKLEHPGICGVHDTGIEGGVPYIAMRYVDGETLGERLSRLGAETTAGEPCSFISFDDDGDEDKVTKSTSTTSSSSIDRPELDRTIAAFEKIALAMHAAHEVGIIHRDIKPGNIMLTKDNEPILLDFGLARDDSDDSGPSLTQTGDLFGTPAYMSPEQITGHRVVLDRRSDIYSLGVTLYECLTGTRAFEAPTRESLYQAIMSKEAQPVRKLNRQIPTDLEVVLQCTMDKDRDKRYQTAASLAEDLRRIRKNEPILAKKVSSVGRAWRWSKRRPAAAVLLLALSIGIPTISGLGVWYWNHRDEVHAQELAVRDEAVEDALDNGYFELHEGDAELAIEAFEKASHLDNASAEAAAGLAQTHMKLEDPNAALEVIVEAERTIVDPRVLMRVKSDILRELGRESEAIALEAAAPENEGSLLWFLAGMRAIAKGHDAHDDAAKKAAFEDAERLLSLAVAASPVARRTFHFQLAHARGHCKTGPSAIGEAIAALWPGSDKAAYWTGFEHKHTDPEQFIIVLNQLLRIDPNNEEAHSSRGEALCDLKRYSEAADAFGEAIRIDPNSLMDHRNRVVNIWNQGQRAEAIDGFDEIIRNFPDDEKIKLLRSSLLAEKLSDEGRLLAKQGQLDDAIGKFKEAIQSNRDNRRTQFDLGNALFKKRDYNAAIAAYDESLRIDPKRKKAHNMRGFALREKGNYPEAILAFNKAIKLDPVDPGPVLNRGYTYLMMKNFEKALADFNRYVELEPMDAIAHKMRYTTLINVGKVKDAIGALQKAIEIDPHIADPQFVNTLVGSGVMLGRQGKFDDARVVLREAVRISPKSAYATSRLAYSLVDPKDEPAHRKALLLAQQAVALEQPTPLIHSLSLWALAEALFATGDAAGALKAANESLELARESRDSGLVQTIEALPARYRLALSK